MPKRSRTATMQRRRWSAITTANSPRTGARIGAPPLVEAKRDLAVGLRRENDTLGSQLVADRR